MLPLLVTLTACSGGMVAPDSGAPDAGASPMDAGAGAVDAGVVDAGTVDAGAVDAGTVDAGALDAGAVDAGAVDAGAVDAGVMGPSCSGLPDVVTFDFTWSDSSSVLTMQAGGVRADTIAVGRITVPTTAAMPLAQPGQVRFVEYIDGQAQRQMTLSRFPCDFRGFVPGGVSRTDPTGVSFPVVWSNDINTQLIFRLSPPGAVVLPPGTTWYVSLRNVDWVTGAPSCGTATCNGLFNFFAPR
ncbi:MAG: hypothetical protein JNJ54_14505 [Myxococcaceae bacterium]|nr:hypothetical protein [Myxococcaceae bacterium]